MPTYEYRCKDCGDHLEVQQAFTDDPLTECPACGGALKKKFGSVGIAFKGSGFYKNDARGSSSGTTPASTETGGTGDSSSTPAPKADTAAASTGSSTSSPTGNGASSKGPDPKGSSTTGSSTSAA
jgi:putative FmdB family regulatory protein